MKNIHDAMVLMIKITLYLTESDTRNEYVHTSLYFRGLILTRMLVKYILTIFYAYLVDPW